MNLGALLAEIKKIVVDTTDDDQQYIDWINRAIREIANDFDFTSLALRTPLSLPVTIAGGYRYALPENFQKKVFKAYNGDVMSSPGDPLPSKIWVCHDWDELDRRDITHLQTGDRVTHIAVQGIGMDSEIGVYPLAEDTLYLWYYAKPPLLANDADVPRWMPEEYHYRVIVPKVVIKNFQLLQDLIKDAPHQSLTYWEEQYKKGLYGEPRGDIGLINFLARDKKPRRHGGRDPLP